MNTINIIKILMLLLWIIWSINIIITIINNKRLNHTIWRGKRAITIHFRINAITSILIVILYIGWWFSL